MTDTLEVTGRDSYVIAQALYEFIRLEQSKPIAERRGSDEQDAKAILHMRGSTTNWSSSCSLTKPLVVSLPTVRGG